MKIDNNYSVWSSQVFTILALCAHEPLPLSTFKRFLAAESNDEISCRIQAIKDCNLLTFLPEQEKPTDSYDKVERVYFYGHTHKAFKHIGKWPLVCFPSQSWCLNCFVHKNWFWVNRKITAVTIGLCIRSVCLVHISMTFELTSFPHK